MSRCGYPLFSVCLILDEYWPALTVEMQVAAIIIIADCFISLTVVSWNYYLHIMDDLYSMNNGSLGYIIEI